MQKIVPLAHSILCNYNTVWDQFSTASSLCTDFDLFSLSRLVCVPCTFNRADHRNHACRINLPFISITNVRWCKMLCFPVLNYLESILQSRQFCRMSNPDILLKEDVIHLISLRRLGFNFNVIHPLISPCVEHVSMFGCHWTLLTSRDSCVTLLDYSGDGNSIVSWGN